MSNNDLPPLPPVPLPGPLAADQLLHAVVLRLDRLIELQSRSSPTMHTSSGKPTKPTKKAPAKKAAAK